MYKSQLWITHSIIKIIQQQYSFCLIELRGGGILLRSGIRAVLTCRVRCIYEVEKGQTQNATNSVHHFFLVV